LSPPREVSLEIGFLGTEISVILEVEEIKIPTMKRRSLFEKITVESVLPNLYAYTAEKVSEPDLDETTTVMSVLEQSDNVLTLKQRNRDERVG